MPHATALYNFVPLPEKIYYPDDGVADVSHDFPFEDGFCGTITFALAAVTPLSVGGEREAGTKSCYRLPDGAYAIPGSTLRGAVRSVLEIASCGYMTGRTEDRRFGHRDPRNTSYRNQVSGAEAGFLYVQDGKWRLLPCVKHRIDGTARSFLRASHDNLGVRGIFSIRQNAESKYSEWRGALEGYALPEISGPKLQRFDVNAIENGKQGILVFTGQHARQKEHEFFFFKPEPGGRFLPICETFMKRFLSLYEGSSLGGQNKHNSWEWRLERYRDGKDKFGVPVFYRQENGVAVSFGLAQMYKLPYNHSTGELTGEASAGYIKGRCDMADVVFGRIGEDFSLKGRVSFSPARAPAGVEPHTEGPTVFGPPKPSYAPCYLAVGQDYNAKNARLRGFKRYPVRNEASVPEMAASTRKNPEVQTSFQTLAAGTTFAGEARFHNLRRRELGALLWAMTFGDVDGGRYRHARRRRQGVRIRSGFP
jgi:CRISPR-associated protein (TIGR03986 family)